jgi:tryptophan-rich sensory protein
MPFTEQYARESAPPEVWETPTFKRINRLLTTVWGAVFALSAILGVIAQQTESSTAREWLNWILPIVLVVGGFKFTAWYAEQARARARAAAGPAS